jgi:ssDNA-binding Zn-finger/Zn-ribbon topoisomerase 1
MQRRKGKNGWFWGCTGYPDCKTTLPDERGKPAPRASAKPAGRCICGGDI